MNILMISMDFPPTVGGISAHVYELSNTLAKAGHQVTVLARELKDGQSYPPLSNIKLHTIKLQLISPLYGLQITRKIKKLLPAVKPDIIHIHGMGPLEWYNIKSVPLVYTNHTSGYLKRIKKGGIRRMALLKRLFKKPDLFLAPSRELLETPFPVAAPKVFISNGIDAKKYQFNQEQRQTLRKELGIEELQPLGILTRRLVEKNGVAFLAKATKHLKNQNLRLLLIGDGPERPVIERELSHHFAGRFQMLGSMTHDAIVPFYSAADFSILPSLMEATSISGLEAMASGLPLLGTNVGGIPELIENEGNGLLCRPADEKDLAEKIDLLLTMDLKKLGARSRELVEEKFDWQQIAQQTITAYESVL
ncbi:MAG: glycosyltransferase family 4 protein [Proteobacteria bacterium]|nr:glycosyltransferase family 4 protein [Pseudomonadota bacterium]MBU1714463.1 glycosyltransferase family 4 protein [Pseudomonadota bacterium]